ncbi:polysaccharide lyase beta-sandwich domain-containing protein [Pedobacter sp. MC2016-14]|uniref:polysaccharide lyase family 8 super-sandwich domain-containing protein n=1 Tax=Pedobacter sp. MC2016-14 TaxID=2897327 RepID=UPI001E49B314|nr:polysaccharide lyase family 8 super-sandwich domain-containing protein [Pedobacter sp. MC2016-14]MCD0487578.1 polysaccharide lyase beta-sandwich domain-containing protein [Pedobacter sp. MC2016-14]
MKLSIKKMLFCGLLLSITSASQAQTAVNGMLLRVRENCKQLLLSDTAHATEQSYRLTDDIRYETDAKGYFKALNAEGSWSDIDYKSNVNSDWSPSWHLYRLMLISRIYHTSKDPKYLEALHRGLHYWITTDPICPNWWQNQINTPYTYSSVMLMMDKAASADELRYLDVVLKPRIPQPNPTGQNKIWQHDIESRLALLHNDEAAFRTAITQMQSVIKIGTDEGIQPDYSFHQHGTMLQFGNYGIHFVNSLLFWMKVTANSPFAFEKEKQQMISDYCTQGLRYVIYKRGMDITAIGRQLRQYAGLKRGFNLYDDFSLLRSFVKENPCQFRLDGFDRLACKDKNKSFWRSAYMLHSQPNRYMMSVKMQGAYFRAVESINSENLLGSFLNDGVTLIQRSAKEYLNIEPLWNWTMLPGITCDTTVDPSALETFKALNPSNFVGQVANGEMGLTAMYYNRLGVKGYKSYFYINNMMVAMGAGIHSANPRALVTTVNQRFKNGKALVKGQGKSGSTWLWQDSIAYIFPDKDQEVKAETSFRKGNWKAIYAASPNETVADSVLSIYMPHLKNTSYAYAIKPDVGLKETKQAASNADFLIVQNTPEIQAIASKGTVMAVFYQAGSLMLPKKIKLSVNQPCLLMFKEGTIWISDPTRKIKEVQLALNERSLQLSLPQGDFAGSTLKVSFK